MATPASAPRQPACAPATTPRALSRKRSGKQSAWYVTIAWPETSVARASVSKTHCPPSGCRRWKVTTFAPCSWTVIKVRVRSKPSWSASCWRRCITRSGSVDPVRPIDPSARVLNPCRAGNPATLMTEASSRVARASASLFAGEELVDLVLDFLEIHERPVDRGEANVRHLVQAAELVHHQFADFTRGNLDLAARSELGLDLVHDAFHRTGGDLALGGRLHQAREQLLAVEVFAAAVLLHDVERHGLDSLVGGEALGALQALAPATDRLPRIGVTGVDHLEVDVTTIGALHLRPVSHMLWSAIQREGPEGWEGGTPRAEVNGDRAEKRECRGWTDRSPCTPGRLRPAPAGCTAPRSHGWFRPRRRSRSPPP